ncbi:MAG: hypothetical protein HY225_00675 [Candidatus Vogelbacteria bacterium]|nr:hypothetical protein [Candidatus Vogelbacteria bacterium]
MLSFLINTAYAACADAPTKIGVIDNITTQIFNPIIGILFGVSFLVFLYGVVEFIQGSSNEKEIEKGKQHIIFGILGLAIIVGVNGLITLIGNTVCSLGS